MVCHNFKVLEELSTTFRIKFNLLIMVLYGVVKNRLILKLGSHGIHS